MHGIHHCANDHHLTHFVALEPVDAVAEDGNALRVSGEYEENGVDEADVEDFEENGSGVLESAERFVEAQRTADEDAQEVGEVAC